MLDQEKTGKFIAEVRRQKGVTQKELPAACCVLGITKESEEKH